MHLFPLVVQSVLIRDNVCGGVWLRGVLNTLSTSWCMIVVWSVDAIASPR